MSKTITEYIHTVGVTTIDSFSGCSSLRDEFQVLKRSYRTRVLSVHPDKNKGGSSESFHAVQEAFEYLRTLGENGQVISYSSYLVLPGNEQQAALVDGDEADRLPCSPGVHFAGWSSDLYYQFYHAILPYGVREAQQFLVVIAGLTLALTFPPEGKPGLTVPFFVPGMVVAENVSRENEAHEMRLAQEERLLRGMRARAVATARKKERRVAALLLNDSWLSALAAGDLDMELNDVLSAILGHLGVSRSGTKAVLLHRLREHAAKHDAHEKNVPKVFHVGGIRDSYVAKEKENKGMHHQQKGGSKKYVNDVESFSFKTPSSEHNNPKARRAFGDVKNVA